MADEPTPGTTSDAAADVASDASAVLTDNAAELFAQLERELGDVVVEHGSALGQVVVRVRLGGWRATAQVLKEKCGCDYLSFISAIDWMPAPVVAEEGSGDTSAPAQPREMTFGVAGSTGRMQVFARVASTKRARWGVTLKTDVDDAAPHVESWVPVYPGADWHERECWEMFGVVFDGHPSLRHLYLPSEFEGHPLRKDFPLLAREVKPWPGLVDVEPMPGGDDAEEESSES